MRELITEWEVIHGNHYRFYHDGEEVAGAVYLKSNTFHAVVYKKGLGAWKQKYHNTLEECKQYVDRHFDNSKYCLLTSKLKNLL